MTLPYRLRLGAVVGVVALIVLWLHAESAQGGSADGLYFEVSSQADGAKVRRLRDARHGVICYVVSARDSATGLRAVGVAISCLPDR